MHQLLTNDKSKRYEFANSALSKVDDDLQYLMDRWGSFFIKWNSQHPQLLNLGKGKPTCYTEELIHSPHVIVWYSPLLWVLFSLKNVVQMLAWRPVQLLENATCKCYWRRWYCTYWNIMFLTQWDSCKTGHFLISEPKWRLFWQEPSQKGD